jgi:hypothetical protein
MQPTSVVTAQALGEDHLYLFVEDTSSAHGQDLLRMYGARGFRTVEEAQYLGRPIAIMRHDFD